MILLQPWCLHVSNICVFTAPKTFTLSSYSQDIWIWLLSSTLCLPINQYPRIPQFFVFLAILVSFKWLLAGRAVNSPHSWHPCVLTLQPKNQKGRPTDERSSTRDKLYLSIAFTWTFTSIWRNYCLWENAKHC